MQEKLLIIDANALFHRAYHALPPLFTKNGQPIGAVFGFFQILFKAIDDIAPEYIAIAFDFPAKTFRHEMYSDYKATRQKADDDLISQFPILKEIISGFGFPIYELEGYEADDVVGSLVNCAKKDNLFCFILTGDQDAIQLVNKSVNVYTMKRGFSDTVLYDVDEVIQKYGFEPAKILSFKALKGDSSDNIPGVPGIGEKTACQLIIKYGDLQNIYKALDEGEIIITDRLKNTLSANKENAFLSYKLAQIKTDLPLCYNKNEGKIASKSIENAAQTLLKYELRSLIDRLPKVLNRSISKGINNIKFSAIMVSDEKHLDKLLSEASKYNIWCIDTETETLNRISPVFLGVSLCFKEGSAYFIKSSDALSENVIVSKLKPFLENKKIGKIGHNIKYDLCVFKSLNIEVKNIVFDTMIAAYLLNPGQRRYSLDELSLHDLDYKKLSIEELSEKKGFNINLKHVSDEALTNYACEDAIVTYLLYRKYKPLIIDSNLEGLFKNIEMPLIEVLVEMERIGFKLDSSVLKKYSQIIGDKIAALTQEICQLSGCTFNLNSPDQLKKVLFEKMEIDTKKSGIKKVKSGGYSTAADELEKLRNIHPIVKKILNYREMVKLKNTYIDALPKLISLNTGRIHTNFNQTIAITGRLSSTEPNLQNIPIKTNLGRFIRNAFIADKGNILITADYSQMELRIIAHLSQDKEMIRVFNEGEDIHSKTASQIFDIKVGDVSSDKRRVAKTINFGIVYGISPHGIATSLGVTHEEARKYLECFFRTYPEVKTYIEETIAKAKNFKEVSTEFGRRRFLTEINSVNPMVRSGAERMAINYPVQGLAADYIKLAMIKLHKIFKDNKDGHMLLQVHDELVFEVKEDKKVDFSKSIKEIMENSVNISVPVVVNIKSGISWGTVKEVENNDQ